MHLFRCFLLPLAGLALAATPVAAAPVTDVMQPAGQSGSAYAAGLAASALNNPPVATGSNAAAGAISTDPAKIALGVQIFDNMGYVELVKVGGRRGIMTNPNLASMPEADRALLANLFVEELEKRRGEILNTLAVTHVDPYSIEQLNQLLAVSKVKIVREAMLYGADPSYFPKPDPNSLTPADSAVLDAAMKTTFVAAFIQNVDIRVCAPSLSAAAQASFARFQAAKAAK